MLPSLLFLVRLERHEEGLAAPVDQQHNGLGLSFHGPVQVLEGLDLSAVYLEQPVALADSRHLGGRPVLDVHDDEAALDLQIVLSAQVLR